MVTAVARFVPHTTAAIAKLTAADLLVGNSVKPDGGGWQGETGESEYIPYVVFWPGGGSPDGNLAQPYQYLDYGWQTTCVGVDPDQAGTLLDDVCAAYVGQRLAVPGRSTYRIQLELARPIERDDTATPHLYYGVAQFTLRTQAA